MRKVIIYCDGGCRGNQSDNNIGGYGAVLQSGEHTKEIYQGFRNTTNNRMEITAAIMALREMKKFNVPIEIRSDSAYLVNCINKKWYVNWMRNGWVTSTKKAVENRDLWIELIDQLEKFAFISFVKVKGHSGEPGNERADQLANMAMDSVGGL